MYLGNPFTSPPDYPSPPKQLQSSQTPNTTPNQGGSEWCEISYHSRNYPTLENSRGSVLQNSHGFHSLQSDIHDQIGLPMIGRIPFLWSSTNGPIDQYTWDEIWDHKGYPNHLIPSVETGCLRIEILMGFDDQG
jgi:hypothetical protein